MFEVFFFRATSGPYAACLWNRADRGTPTRILPGIVGEGKVFQSREPEHWGFGRAGQPSVSGSNWLMRALFEGFPSFPTPLIRVVGVYENSLSVHFKMRVARATALSNGV
jgi:hypothetical protein